MLIMCLLVLINTSNTLLFTMATGNDFTALDFWMTGCKTMAGLALLEYFVLLRIRSHLERKKRKAAVKNTKRRSSTVDLLSKKWCCGIFPEDPDEFCHYVDMRVEVVAQISFHIFCAAYLGYYYNQSLYPTRHSFKFNDVP